MPVLSWGHSNYWAGSGEAPAAAADDAPVAYPTWQASVILPSGLGALQVFWERYVAYLRAHRGEH